MVDAERKTGALREVQDAVLANTEGQKVNYLDYAATAIFVIGWAGMFWFFITVSNRIIAKRMGKR
jgi:hypothetical protein